MTIALMAAHQGAARAQDAAGPRAAVDRLFLGIRMGNATMLRQIFAPDVRFVVLDATRGSAQAVAQSLDGFIRAVEVSRGAWNEQAYDIEVQADEAVASVRAPYTFYVDGRISHCGVNSIELARSAEGWRITQISDVQRAEACPDPLAGR